MTFDAVYNANKTAGTGISYNYTNLGNGSVLRTGKMANGQAVPEQKFQYDLGPNDEFQVTQNGTPVIVSKNGNQITSVKVAPGFQSGDLASKYTPVYSNGQMSILNTVSGQVNGADGNGSSSLQSSGGFPQGAQSVPNSAAGVNNVAGMKQGGHFIPYSSPQDSFNAVVQDIQSKQQGNTKTGLNGNSTLEQFVNTWVNGDPNKPAVGYNADNVSQFLNQNGISGISKTTPFGQIDPTKLASAVAHFETGYNPGGNSSSTQVNSSGVSTAPFDSGNPEDSEAAKYLQGGLVKSGNGKTSPTDSHITARANIIAAQLGLVNPGESFDATALKADQKASMKVLIEQVPQKAQLQSNLDAADSNFNMLTQFMSDHGLNASDIPLANQLQQAINSGGINGKDAVGAQASMSSALAGLSTEYSQILARGGQRNETVDKEAAKLIPGNLSPKELQDVVDYIKKEGQNVLKSKDTAIANARKSFSNPTAQSDSSSSNDPLGIR